MATIFIMRAKGMTMGRMPLFGWNMIIDVARRSSLAPFLTGAMDLLFIDRHSAPAFFDPPAAGVAILYQHLFWFYGHPDVYMMFLPFLRIVTEMIPVFARKRFFGYPAMVFSLLAIATLSMSVWGHHMFATGRVANDVLRAHLPRWSIAAGVRVLHLVGTMWGGSLVFDTPMLFALRFL